MSFVRKVAVVSLAAAGLGVLSAINPPTAQAAPCGNHGGPVCASGKVCVGWGVYYCETIVLGRYEPAASF